jgi:TolB-like protein
VRLPREPKTRKFPVVQATTPARELPMPENGLSKLFREGKLLPWAAGLLVLAGVVGAALMVSRPSTELALPAGFTVTTGEDSGVLGVTRREREEASLGELIAATVGPEGDFQASIAILPLENRTGDAVFDTVGSGMVDELIARLSRIRGLKVISRQSVQELEGLGLTLGQVADTLGVDHLLVGTAIPHQGDARIQVRLLLVSGEVEIWQNDYSVDRRDRVRAVEEISDEVGAALLEEVPALSLRGPSRTTDSPGYVSYVAGNRLLNTRTSEGLIRAIEAYRDAVAADSAFAPAFAGLSSAYALSITYRYDLGMDAYSAAGLALGAATEAIRLDPNLAEGYAARGYAASLSLAPAHLVHQDFAKALELQPNAPNVAAWYANLLVREGYYDQALAEAQRAVDLDPLSPARRTGLAFEALRARDYRLAVEQARAAISLEAAVVLPRSIQAQALLLSGRSEECLDLDLGPHAGIRAMCLHALGRLDQAEEVGDSIRAALLAGGAVSSGFTNVVAAGDLAAYLAWTGEPERAMPWIHRAYALSPSGIDARVLESGVFDRLLTNSEMRREVAGIRDRVWPRVQRELAEVKIGGASPDRRQ